jgi:hypothetical protein
VKIVPRSASAKTTGTPIDNAGMHRHNIKMAAKNTAGKVSRTDERAATKSAFPLASGAAKMAWTL